MPKGGYRPGAGRPKGAKDSKPRKCTPAQVEAEQIRQMLLLGTKAKAKFYQEFLIRVSKGDKLSLAEKKLMDQLSVELAKEIDGGKAEPGAPEGLDPLTYMLRVMNDPNEDPAVRRQMAVAAAPYVHPRKGEGIGKKEEKADRARAAGQGRFSPSAPPKLKVVGSDK